jgi:hypothetical protein
VDGTSDYGDPHDGAVRAPHLGLKTVDRTALIECRDEFGVPLRAEIHPREDIAEGTLEYIGISVPEEIGKGDIHLHERPIDAASEDALDGVLEIVVIRVRQWAGF